MDEKLLASIEASKMLGLSTEILKCDAHTSFYVPLVELRNNENESKNWVREEEEMRKKYQAASMLKVSDLPKKCIQNCSYIPLINLGNEKNCKNCVQEIKVNNIDLNFLFDSSKHMEHLSEACSMSSKLPVNSSEEENSQRDAQRNESRGGFNAINGFLPQLLYPKQQKITMKEWTADEYENAEKEICTSIKYSYGRSLIVWCSTSSIKSELVHTWLKKNGTSVYVYDRWIHEDMPKTEDAWGGVIAVYPDRAAAMNAEKEIPLQHESLNAIGLSKVIQCFVKSELKFFSEGKFQVLIHAKVSGKEHIQKIEAMLYRFGQVEFCTYDYLIRNSAVDFDVTYTFATHAFLAKTVLDNLPFGSGLLDVEIKMDPKMKAILYDFRSQMKKLIGNKCFPL